MSDPVKRLKMSALMRWAGACVFLAAVSMSSTAQNSVLYQQHDDGSIWLYTGVPCNGNTCSGWTRIDNNSHSRMLAAGDTTVVQMHDDGNIYTYDIEFGGPWARLDQNPQTAQIAVDGTGTIYQMHTDGSIFEYGLSGGPGWEQIDNNPRATEILPSGSLNQHVFQLHQDGTLWQSTGLSCRGTSCPGWVQLDNTPLTNFVVEGNYTYQTVFDGTIKKLMGGNWLDLDRNPRTVQITVGETTKSNDMLYQLHDDGTLWRYTGPPCNGSLCAGWTMLDNNPATWQIAAAGKDLYQLHSNGEIFKWTGAICSNGACPGWQRIDVNPAAAAIRAAYLSGDRLSPHDAFVHSVPGDPPGEDPLNVIISANSDITFPDGLIEFLGKRNWTTVQIGAVPNPLGDQCIRPENGAVQLDGSTDVQQVSMRIDSCRNIFGTGGGSAQNHLRAYRQNVTGAWYVAVSEEHFCGTDHCIDSNGFNQGRDDLKVTLEGIARDSGIEVFESPSVCPKVVPAPWQGCMQIDQVPLSAPGSIKGVPYDGVALEVQITLR